MAASEHVDRFGRSWKSAKLSSAFPSEFELQTMLPAACLIAGQYAQYRHSDVANEPMTLKQIAKTVERALVLLILLVAKESETFSQNAAAAGK
jgi:hypothetical protein